MNNGIQLNAFGLGFCLGMIVFSIMAFVLGTYKAIARRVSNNYVLYGP